MENKHLLSEKGIKLLRGILDSYAENNLTVDEVVDELQGQNWLSPRQVIKLLDHIDCHINNYTTVNLKSMSVEIDYSQWKKLKSKYLKEK